MRRLLGILASLAVAVPLGSCGEPTQVQPSKIDALKAYYCAVPNQSICTSRGDPIPDGALPPVNEAFQVWAFYHGWLSTYWRVNAQGDSAAAANKFLPDSANVYIDFHGGGASYYTLHVYIKGQAGLLTDDSLRWNYTATP